MNDGIEGGVSAATAGGECRQLDRYPSTRCTTGGIDAATAALIAAFCRGLEADPSAATAAIHRRDLAIARQLVAAGATADEAELYAREMAAVAGRLAPVNLRSFERERLSWRAQRRGTTPRLAGLQLVTGPGLTDNAERSERTGSGSD